MESRTAIEQATGVCRCTRVQVADAEDERTVAVSGPQRPDLVFRHVAGDAVEAVRATERQTVVVRAYVLDRVVGAACVVEVVHVFRVSRDGATRLVAYFQRTDVVDDGVVLATQRDHIKLARHADVSLTAEHEVALSQLAGVHVKTVLDHEDSFHATAEVFRAAQKETAALQHAARHVIQVVAICIRIDVETFINEAVKGHSALRVSHA